MSIADKLVTIAENIEKIDSRAYSAGYTSGGQEAYNAGIEQGKQAEYDRFWDAFQQNGNRKSYLCGFAGRAWSDETFKPKYPLTFITNATNMFFYSNVEHIDCELGFDTYISLMATFDHSAVERISKFKSDHTINFLDNTFGSCTKLTDISFVEGSVIGKNISFKDSPLTVESMNNIIAALKDYSNSGATYTVTFKADREDMLTAEEKAAATNKGWTLVWS